MKDTPATAALKRVRAGRTIDALSHLASVRSGFARFSTAATLSENGASTQRVIKQMATRQAAGEPDGVLGAADPSKPRMTILRR